MLTLLIVEDNDRLATALQTGFAATGRVAVIQRCASGEAALAWCLAQSGAGARRPDVVLMDVQLAGPMNGVQAAVALRREFPRLPVVFYSIQDDAQYYRDFRAAGILSHYAYVRKSNYLLPELVVPLLVDAVAGRSFIDPEIEARVEEVRTRCPGSHGAAGTPRAAGGTAPGPGTDQRADRRAHGLPGQAHHQPHQRPDLRRLGAGRQHHRRKGGAHPRRPDRDCRAPAHLGCRRYAAGGDAGWLDAMDRAAMTGYFWFDWPLVALSLANGILLLWLGLTVLLNAEHRTPGVTLLALAAWLGSAFFAAHTAILASGEGPASAALNLWWEAGWLPLLVLPLAWYAVVVWYSSLGDTKPGLSRRHLLLAAMTAVAVVLGVTLFAAHRSALIQ